MKKIYQYYLLNENKQPLHVSMNPEFSREYAKNVPDAVYIGRREISENNIAIIEEI